MKKNPPVFLAAPLLIGCAAPAEGDSYRQINMDEAITMMEEETGYIILDVRTPQEYREGHIPGSKNVPLQQLDKITSVAHNKETALFVYCYSGGRSRQAASMLRHMGYTNVQNIGGITAYSGKVEK